MKLTEQMISAVNETKFSKGSKKKTSDSSKDKADAVKIVKRAKEIASKESTNNEDALSKAIDELKLSSEAALIAREQYIKQ